MGLLSFVLDSPTYPTVTVNSSLKHRFDPRLSRTFLRTPGSPCKSSWLAFRTRAKVYFPGALGRLNLCLHRAANVRHLMFSMCSIRSLTSSRRNACCFVLSVAYFMVCCVVTFRISWGTSHHTSTESVFPMSATYIEPTCESLPVRDLHGRVPI